MGKNRFSDHKPTGVQAVRRALDLLIALARGYKPALEAYYLR